MDIFEGCGEHYFANLCKIYTPLYLVITQRNTTHTLKPGVGWVLEKERGAGEMEDLQRIVSLTASDFLSAS